MNALFYTSGAIAVIAALLVITSTNAAHAVVYLVLAFLAIASVFFTLGAPLIAVLQIVIYAGAIIVLFVFVVMMLNLGSTAVERERVWLRSPVWIVPAILGVVLLVEFVAAMNSSTLALPNTPILHHSITPVPPKAVGRSLYSDYIIGVELASFLLLAALAAAFHFGVRHEEAGDG